MKRKMLLILSFCCLADVLCNAGTSRHDKVFFAGSLDAAERQCVRSIPRDLIPENKDIDLDSFITSISRTMASAECPLLAPEPSEEKVVTVVSEEYGQLERILRENEADTATELIVCGPIDESDFKALWRCASNGHLRTLDLGKTMIKDNTVPDRALYDYVQFEEGLMLRISKIVLPDDVVRIGKAAFPMMGLQEINIPTSLKEIGTSVFAYDFLLDCPIVFPEGVSRIESHTFWGCRSLTTPVSLPSTLRMIGPFAFGNTLSMHEIDLNDGLEYIADCAFQNCGLEEVRIPESTVWIGDMVFQLSDGLQRISLPESIEAVPYGLLSYCNALEKVTIPDGVKVIENSAFMWCTNLKEVRLPSSLEIIELDAFSGCDMETVVLPRNLRSLGSSCLEIENLHTVYCESEVPPVCDSDPFPPFYPGWISEAVLYVPVGCGESYRNALVWSQFNEIKETDAFPSAVTSIVMPTDRADDLIYDLSGRRVANPLPNHIYIKNGRKILTY